MNKKIISLSLLLMLLLNVSNINSLANGDVPSSWANEAINEIKQLNLLDDYIFTKYQDNITREDFTYLIYTLFNHLNDRPIEALTIEDYELTFSDTDDPMIIATGRAGIVSGLPNGEFKPNDSITREQMAKMFVNMIKVMNCNIDYELLSDLKFQDESEISPWAIREIKLANKYNIIQGVGNHTINPKGFATREACLVLFYRIYKDSVFKAEKDIYSKGTGMIQDNFNHVYYIDGHKIIKKTQGANVTIYTHTDNLASLVLYKDQLFVKDAKTKEIFSIDLDGQGKKEVIQKPVTQFTIGRQYIYYVKKDDHNVYKVSLEGKLPNKILDQEVSEIIYYNDQLIYTDNQQKCICTYDVFSQEIKTLNNQEGKQLKVWNDYLTWLDPNTNNVYIQKMNEVAAIKVAENTNAYGQAKGKIYFYNHNDRINGQPLLYYYDIRSKVNKAYVNYEIESFDIDRSYILMKVAGAKEQEVYIWELY